jgi:ABC-type Na+ efflux pump permease subunit
MASLWAMARYEALMHWRRGGFTLGIVLLCLVTLGLAAWQHSIGQANGDFYPAGVTSRIDILSGRVLTVLQISQVVMVLIVLMMSAESVPLDRYTRTEDLLSSFPLTRTAYLSGKISGVLLVVLLHMGFAILVIGVGFWMIFGAFHLQAYLAFWVGTGLPFTAITAACGLLLGSFHPTRRRAILLTLPFTIYAYAFVLTRIGGFMAISAALVPDLTFFNLYAIPLLFIKAEDVLLELVLQLIALWSAAWLWLKWREGR